MTSIFTRGVQVAYVPNESWCDGVPDLNGPYVEFDFIESEEPRLDIDRRTEIIGVRYWGHTDCLKESTAADVDRLLRTTSCSETTLMDNLVLFESVDATVVAAALELYC